MKSKFLILVILATIVMVSGFEPCFSQSWEYSSVIKSAQSPALVDIKIDKNKNIYVASDYRHMTTPLLIESNGFNDIFIAKYNELGAIVWVKNFGGNNPFPAPPNNIDNTEYINCIYVDTINNYLFASGLFYGTAQFGSFTLNSSNLNSRSTFLLKMDLDGNIIWAKRVPVNVLGMVTDNIGNLYFCGGNGGLAVFDSTHTISSGSLVVKFDLSGGLLWVKKISNWSSGIDFSPRDIKLHNSRIYLNGYTNNDTITLDTIVRFVPLNTKWSALTCLDENGNAKWLSLFAGNNSECGKDFSLDKNGNSYTTGYFTGTGYFGNDTLTANVGQKNMFLVKHDSLGHLLWVKQIHATSSLGNCVSNIVDSTLYVTGWFKGNAHFNDSIVAATTIDMFLATYNTNGVCQNVKNFGIAEGQVVVQDSNNSTYIIGFYYSNITIGVNTYSTYANPDIFIAKLSGLTSVGNTSRLINTNNLLTIYANPNTGKCNITIPEEFQNEKNLTLQIFDLKGNQIQQAKIELLDNKIKVNIEAEAKGVYNAVLSNGKKNYSGRIIFE